MVLFDKKHNTQQPSCLKPHVPVNMAMDKGVDPPFGQSRSWLCRFKRLDMTCPSVVSARVWVSKGYKAYIENEPLPTNLGVKPL